MKIGILTFHWVANYGAVLQAYALSRKLEEFGHEVQVINYKPWIYDNNLYSLIRYRKIFHPFRLRKDYKKEQLFVPFRENFLKLTKRVKRQVNLGKLSDDLDCVISGSDQVMNPSFVRGGEPGGSTAYYLDFGRKKMMRVAYAVSFGTIKYPSNLLPCLTPLISHFNALSVRERTGVSILHDMNSDGIVVPDPTILLSGKHYQDIFTNMKKHNKICYYILHDRKEFCLRLQEHFQNKCLLNNDFCAVDTWLSNIKGASSFITNSFHGCVFSILFHVPFMIILKEKENVGMNDRFYTLLEFLDLRNRITTEIDTEYEILNKPIDWDYIDKRLDEYREVGNSFLIKTLGCIK